jgi:DNA-binding transcriptional LysR family regulator
MGALYWRSGRRGPAVVSMWRLSLASELVDARGAGIHLGEFLHRDMTAVTVTGKQRAAVVAAPSYFAAHAQPRTPRVTVVTSGPVIVGDAQFMIGAALDGVGLAYILEDYVADHIARGELVRVLEDWCPPFEAMT